MISKQLTREQKVLLDKLKTQIWYMRDEKPMGRLTGPLLFGDLNPRIWRIGRFQKFTAGRKSRSG